MTAACIVIAGTLAIDPAQRDQLVRMLDEVATATRAEPGCVEYRISVDLEDDNRFRILEEWASAADLEAHMRTPHIATFLAQLSRMRVLAMTIDRYVASAKRRLV